jgi:hypothetical protein
MEFLGYLANGGLERLLIIGVATLIGYWGYRIYARSQMPGLALIALSAVVLFSVILTSKQHLQSMNDNLLAVASLETAAPAPVEQVEVEMIAAPASQVPEPAAIDTAAQTPGPTPTEEAQPAVTADAGAGAEADVVAEEDARVQRLVPLASGQELGGRITSVRSDKLTLEWSDDSSGPRVIRPTAPE